MASLETSLKIEMLFLLYLARAQQRAISFTYPSHIERLLLPNSRKVSWRRTVKHTSTYTLPRVYSRWWTGSCIHVYLQINEVFVSAMQPSVPPGYNPASFTTFSPRADASPDTVRGWIRSWFSNRGVKFPALQANIDKDCLGWKGHLLVRPTRDGISYAMLGLWRFLFENGRLTFCKLVR